MIDSLRAGAKGALAHIPGALELVLAGKFRLANPRRDDYPGRAFGSWLAELGTAQASEAEAAGCRVLLFACRRTWIDFSLAVAVILLGRGCHVEFVYLPQSWVDREDTPAERKSFDFYYRHPLRRIRHPRFRATELDRIEAARPTDAFYSEAVAQSMTDVRHILQREEIDVAADARQRALFQFRLARNLDCICRMSAVLAAREQVLVLVPNGNVRELGAACRAARLAGRVVNCFDEAERTSTIVIARAGSIRDWDTTAAWRADAPHVLSKTREIRVAEYMRIRRGTRWEGFIWSPQTAGYTGNRRQTLAALNIEDDDRRIALLCPNIAWDSAILGRDAAFRSHSDWLRQTVRYLGGRGECLLILRVHPDERRWGGEQLTEDIIREHCGSIPDNVCLVRAEDEVNTYDLMDICDFGLAYNSTTGMEMALRSIPVIVAGQPHYAGKGFTADAATSRAYFEALDAQLGHPGERLSPEQTALAWCYADVYFERCLWPFPWDRPSLRSDLAAWPIARVLSAEGRARFGATVDEMIARPASNAVAAALR